MTLRSHLFVSSSDGGLYDTRIADWSGKPPLRANYQRTHSSIATVADLKATLRNGGYAWPGGYPLFFVTSDGGALSFEAVRAELATIMDSIANNHCDGWRVVAVDTNWEDSTLMCDHTNKRIPSAYGDDDDDGAAEA